MQIAQNFPSELIKNNNFKIFFEQFLLFFVFLSNFRGFFGRGNLVGRKLARTVTKDK